MATAWLTRRRRARLTRGAWRGLGLAGVLLLLAFLPLLYWFQPYLQHDCAVHMSMGDELLDGRRPYVDVLDTNPPLSPYLGMVPMLTARLTGWSPLTAAQVWMALLVLWTVTLAYRLLPRTPAALRPDEAAVFCGFVLAGTLFVYREGQFGQREQLFVLLCLPLLLLRWARYGGAGAATALAVAAGVLGALGAALKPHFLASVFAVELLFLIRYRRWRALVAPEAIAFVATGAAYALSFLVVPGAREYFTRWVPLLTAGYRAYGKPWHEAYADFAAQPQVQFAVFLAVVALWLAIRTRVRLGLLLAALLLLLLGALAGAVGQAKGWPYHAVPIWMAVLLVGGAIVLTFWRVLRLAHTRRRRRRFREFGPVILAALGLAAVVMFPDLPARVWKGERRFPESDPWQDAIRRHARPGEGVLFIDSSIWPAFPATTLAGAKFGSRYSSAFPLPMVYLGAKGYHAPGAEPDAERRCYEELVEDIRTRRPRMVFILARWWPQGCPSFFNFDEWLGRRNFHATALKDYREQPRIGDFRVFVLPPDPPPPPASQP